MSLEEGKPISLLVSLWLSSPFSVTFSWDFASFSIYTWLAISRFFLGFGIGGEYPFSASESNVYRGQAIAWVFSLQGVGSFTASLFVVLFLFFCLLLLTDMKYELVWRLALGFPLIPTLIISYFRLKSKETTEFKQVSEGQNVRAKLQGIKELVTDKKLRFWLCGTAGSWFIFDIAFYANSLFNSTVTSLLGLGSTPNKEALNSLILASMAFAWICLCCCYHFSTLKKKFANFGLCYAVNPLSLHWTQTHT